MRPRELLSFPSKMPGAAWGTSAGRDCPAMRLSINAAASAGLPAICGTCYAQKGRYGFGAVKAANTSRGDWERAATRDTADPAESAFADEMIAEIGTWAEREIRAGRVPYFRIYSSGDFQSVHSIRAWDGIAKALPHVRFWAPTRTYRIDVFLEELRALAALPNVTIRPSADAFNQTAPAVDGLHAGSGAGTVFTCPASNQGGECGSCRLCWDSKMLPVYYRAH